jgi:hypothetical protein
VLPYAENEAYALDKLKDSPEAEAEAERAWRAVGDAQALLAELDANAAEKATAEANCIATTRIPQSWNLRSEADAIKAIIELAELDAEEGDEEATCRRLHTLADAARGFVAGRGDA